MELTVTRDTVRLSGPVLDASADHPVECDVILPDYCPDIGRMLGAEAQARTGSKTLDGTKLKVDGELLLRIIYVPADSGGIRSAEHEEPFSKAFDISAESFGTAESAATQASATQASVRVGQVTVRPVGPRRVQIRASLTVAAKAWDTRSEDTVSGCSDPGVELLRRSVTASELVGAAERTFAVADELSIDYGKPAADAVISASASAVLADCKVISGKVVVKGELMVSVLYAARQEADGGDDSGASQPAPAGAELIAGTLPLSQIIDLDGVGEDCVCSVSLSPGFVHAQPKTDDSGANRVISVDTELTVSVTARRPVTFSAVSDAYSPASELKLQTKTLSFDGVAERTEASEMLRQTLDLGEAEFKNIIYCSARVSGLSAACVSGAAQLSGELTVLLLGEDSSGSLTGAEKRAPFTLREELSAAGDGVRLTPEVTVVSAACTPAGPGRAELRAQCAVTVEAETPGRQEVMTDLAYDGEAPAPARGSTLTLCYADSGESVWDIAKRYRAPVDAVMRENGIEGENIEQRCMLLIPGGRCARG